MADTDNGMPTIEVKILRTFFVPHLTSFTLYDIDIK